MVFLKLLGVALIPVVFSLAFYLLKKRTKFRKLPFLVQQIIIGTVFGLIAIFGTEFGVEVGGATANARDAAPLCAGLIFGGPAGIIAGVIGGVERWFAAYWGAGAYTQIACSVSTVLAGIYSAFLRKFMFDHKRPTWGLGFATGVVMEVVHLTLVFVTHLDDMANAYRIVQICTIPMILCNAASVALAIITLDLYSHKADKGNGKYKKISQQVQAWLLACVVFAYFVTTLFVFTLQTQTAVSDTQKTLQTNISDVHKDISDSSDSSLLEITKYVAHYLDENPNGDLVVLRNKQKVSEISIIDKEGIIVKSTVPEHIGYDMGSKEQSNEFEILNDEKGYASYVQEYQPIGYDNTVSMKYAGYILKKGGYVQVGYDPEKFRMDISKQVIGRTENRHIGNEGYLLIADDSLKVVSGAEEYMGKQLSEIGIEVEDDAKMQKMFTCNVSGEKSYCMYTSSEGFYIVGVMPESEVFALRDAMTYVNSYMEVIVFGLLFFLIYMLIKKLVVNNIRIVNNSLSRIIDGDLDVTVDVHTSDEFASLSDDINSTVTTLKRYISEAAARIDKELEFAKNIQHSALPSVFPAYPNIPQFDIYATMNTAKEVGGDFYDFYMLGEDKLAFLIADVSGKGIPAAMFMMTAKTMIKNFAETGMDVNDVFTRANEKLCEGNEAGMFVTAWMGILDIRSGHVTFANAGHNPPVIYRKGEKFEYLKSRAGFVLAGMEGVKYKLQEFVLNPGDKIYLYTDGVTEATNAHDELYGEDRLESFLNADVTMSPEKTLLSVKADIDEFVGEAEQFDDITMVMVEYKGEQKEENCDAE